MTKNVNVVDESGKQYVPTYAKRAKGLVKNGRARWVDENTICLACPPDDMNLEDTEMEKKITSIENSQAEQINDAVNPNLKAALETAGKIAEQKNDQRRELLDRIDSIIAQGDALMQVVQSIRTIPVNESPNGGFDGQARAEAIGNIYAGREITNQKILDMLWKLYEEGKPAQATPADQLAKIDWVGVMPETAEKLLKALRSE